MVPIYGLVSPGFVDDHQCTETSSFPSHIWQSIHLRLYTHQYSRALHESKIHDLPVSSFNNDGKSTER